MSSQTVAEPKGLIKAPSCFAIDKRTRWSYDRTALQQILNFLNKQMSSARQHRGSRPLFCAPLHGIHKQRLIASAALQRQARGSLNAVQPHNRVKRTSSCLQRNSADMAESNLKEETRRYCRAVNQQKCRLKCGTRKTAASLRVQSVPTQPNPPFPLEGGKARRDVRAGRG